MSELIKLDCIDLDTSIQCRALLDDGLIASYAEEMKAGADFPKVDLFGTEDRSWIGDGWHRVYAATQAGFDSISADLHPGGRREALKHALSANATHGKPRTISDKRLCVEIALREFPRLSSRAIAELCAVSPGLVDGMRPQVPTVGTSQSSRTDTTRTGRDGKQHPARRKPREPKEPKQKGREASCRVGAEEPTAPHELYIAGPAVVVKPEDDDFATDVVQEVIARLKEIPKGHPGRRRALRVLHEWVCGQLGVPMNPLHKRMKEERHANRDEC